jgi:23S rRNA pseudouridine2605 synthase
VPLWPPGHVPLERALSKLGLLSRTEARAAIVAGRVRLAGEVVRDPNLPVVPERLQVAVDGLQGPSEPSGAGQPLVVALHKPRGLLTTQRDPQGRPTVFDLLQNLPQRVVAVGRLDQATTGLLLLTSDTQLANRLTDPVYALERIYLVEVEGLVTQDTARQLQDGVLDAGERLAASRVVIRKTSGKESQLLLTLTEGKNREVRRLCALVGHPVRRLKRIHYGPVALGDLPAGQWREIDPAPLYAAVQLRMPADRRSASL